MSVEALAVCLKAINDLDVNELLTVKQVIEQKGKQRVLRRGDIVVYTGASHNGRFHLVQNETKLIVQEMRRTRVLVKHQDPALASIVPAFLTSPESMMPTGEKVDLPPALKIRRRGRQYEY